MRDGYVYVQGHGEVYQVAIGAPLPGLGAVEQVKRQDGRWLVVTPKGLIVSLRDRRLFRISRAFQDLNGGGHSKGAAFHLCVRSVAAYRAPCQICVPHLGEGHARR